MENPVRFADRTRWAKFSWLRDNDDRPKSWNDLDSYERFIARQTTGVVLRMLLERFSK